MIGPGSWFTSVLVHLLVPDLASAVHETSARRVLTLNLAPQPGETDGLSPEAHLAALAAHAPDLRVDVVLADKSVAAAAAELPAAVQGLGARLVLADVASVDDPARHDVLRLAAAYQEICSTTD